MSCRFPIITQATQLIFPCWVYSISERAQALGDDHPTLGPKQIYEFLSNLMYARRSKMDPLWNAMLLGGVKDGERYVPLRGFG